jgi:hypothetical protein
MAGLDDVTRALVRAAAYRLMRRAPWWVALAVLIIAALIEFAPK